MDQLSKIVVEVETKGLDEAIEKVTQLNELMEKNIKLQEKSMSMSKSGNLQAQPDRELDEKRRKMIEDMRAEMKARGICEDSSSLAHVEIKREESITTVTVDGQKLRGVRSVSFSQKAGGLPILEFELVCEKVSIDSAILLHVPEVYKSHKAKEVNKQEIERLTTQGVPIMKHNL